MGFERLNTLHLAIPTRGRLLADRLDVRRQRYWRRRLHGRRVIALSQDEEAGRAEATASRTTCPACHVQGAPDLNTVCDVAYATGSAHEYARCRRCGHRWLVRSLDQGVDSPEPGTDFTARLMTSRSALSLVYGPRVRWLARRCPDSLGGRVLDVGCGTGGFLSLLHRKHGCECTGIEMNPGLSGLAPEGVRVETQRVEDYCPSSPFDLVTFFHVLEHLERPAETLLAVRDALSVRGGCLCIEVPVADGLASFLFGRYWFPHLPPYHRHLFTEQSLLAMLRGELSGLVVEHTARIYVPGEYVASAVLPFSQWLPHPLREGPPPPRHRIFAAAVPAGILAVLATALEGLSAVSGPRSRLRGSLRVLVRLP